MDLLMYASTRSVPTLDRRGLIYPTSLGPSVFAYVSSAVCEGSSPPHRTPLCYLRPFHRGDITSLRNCSRVCKHWVPLSRHRLSADIGALQFTQALLINVNIAGGDDTEGLSMSSQIAPEDDQLQDERTQLSSPSPQAMEFEEESLRIKSLPPWATI